MPNKLGRAHCRPVGLSGRHYEGIVASEEVGPVDCELKLPAAEQPASRRDQMLAVTIRSPLEAMRLGLTVIQLESTSVPLAHAINMAGTFAPAAWENG